MQESSGRGFLSVNNHRCLIWSAPSRWDKRWCLRFKCRPKEAWAPRMQNFIPFNLCSEWCLHCGLSVWRLFCFCLRTWSFSCFCIRPDKLLSYHSWNVDLFARKINSVSFSCQYIFTQVHPASLRRVSQVINCKFFIFILFTSLLSSVVFNSFQMTSIAFKHLLLKRFL